MAHALSQVGKKALAVAILVAAVYLLFKLVVGFISSIVWILVAVVAVVAVIWAVRTL